MIVQEKSSVTFAFVTKTSFALGSLDSDLMGRG